MTQKSSGFFNWINSRLPIVNTYERHLSKHPVPKKVNFWYMFGALASSSVNYSNRFRHLVDVWL